MEETAIGFPIALFRHNWNANATMQWEFAAPLPHTNAPPPRTMTYDDDNRLATVDSSSVTLDSDGNLISGPLTNDTFATYTFDARNRLINVGGVTNAYDPAGNRVAQAYGTNSVAYVVNPNAKLPQVLMRMKNGVTNYYVYGAGLLYQVTETATATNTLTYHYDNRGSTVALSDDNGNVTDRYEYSLYATMTYHAGTSDTPFLFNGRYGVMTDPNGLLYMRARYYNPFLCRFINADPTGFSGGMNFYAYANGNPVSLLDPFGLNAAATGDTAFSWNPNEFSQNAASWQNDINNSHSCSVAGTLDTLVSIGAGYASIPYLGAGSGTFSASPSLQTLPGLLGDVGTAAGLAAGGLSPLAGANAPLFGSVSATGTGAIVATADSAQNVVNGVRLANDLSFQSAQSTFNVDGTLSEGAIINAKQIFAPGTLGNSDIPAGFGKYTTQTITSPSGNFQVHFYMNPTSGEVYYGLDYKSVFNNPIGH